MRQKIDIYSVEERKTSKGAVYWSYKTNSSQMSCFDAIVAGEINQKGINKTCDIETATNNNYTNITMFYGAEGEISQTAPRSTTDNKIVSIIMAYAKDLVVANKIKLEDYHHYCKSMLDTYKELSDAESS